MDTLVNDGPVTIVWDTDIAIKADCEIHIRQSLV